MRITGNLLTLLASRIWLKEQLTVVKSSCIVVGCIGIVCFCQPDLFQNKMESVHLDGSSVPWLCWNSSLNDMEMDNALGADLESITLDKQLDFQE